MAKIRIGGLDGSLRNFGIAKLDYETDTGELELVGLKLIETEKTKAKQVRASSDTYERARTLATEADAYLEDCDIIFAEIPFGGKSYDAVLGFGIVIGVYGALSLKTPLIEVAPAETKKAAVGTRTASKEEMIAWAFEKFPDGPWLRHAKNGKGYSKGDPTNANEHLADGCGVAFAGIKTPAFRQAAAMLATSLKKAA
jgi:Holliday junction resolvasome RuvABC endonuclease subunit